MAVLNSIRLFAVVLAFLGLCTQRAAAEVLYGADGGGGNPDTNLYTLNPATGAVVSTIGRIGFAVTGFAFHPLTGVLYGTTGAMSPVSPNSLIRINTTTGAGTLVGPHGDGPVADIAFRADGTLFGWSEGSDDLVTINTATGVLTIVADSGLGTFGDGMSFSRAGILFYCGEGNDGKLRTVNTATGLTTDVATLSGSPGEAGDAISAAAFNSAGTFFAVDLKSTRGGSGAAFLVTIDTTTGAITNVGATVNGLDAIAFSSAPGGPSAPALSEWALFVLMVLLGSIGVRLARRRSL